MKTITLTEAVRYLLAEGVTTPARLAVALDDAEYSASADAIILDPSTWWATSDGDDDWSDDSVSDGAEAAEAYADAGDWGDEEAELLVSVWREGIDSAGEDCRCDEDTHRLTVNEGGPALAAQRDLTVLASDVGEFATDYVGVGRPEYMDCPDRFFTWSRNGGTRGAHDRMCGDGIWRERYETPREIEPAEAIRLVMLYDGLDRDEAIAAIAAACSWWTDDRLAEECPEVE